MESNKQNIHKKITIKIEHFVWHREALLSSSEERGIQQKSSYTHRTQGGKQNYQKLPCRSTNTLHKYSSIFQVFIVLIIQIKRHQKSGFKCSRTAKLTPFSPVIASFQFLTSNRDAFSQMYRPTSLMAPCPEMNYCQSTGYISNSFGMRSPIYTKTTKLTL